MSVRTFRLHENMPTEGKIAFSMPSDCPQILTVSTLATPFLKLPKSPVFLGLKAIIFVVKKQENAYLPICFQ